MYSTFGLLILLESTPLVSFSREFLENNAYFTLFLFYVQDMDQQPPTLVFILCAGHGPTTPNTIIGIQIFVDSYTKFITWKQGY